MANSSPDTPTSSSPDPVHPCHVDDSELPPAALAWTWLCALPAMVCVLLALPPMMAMLVVVDRWRAWKGRVDGSR
jgi:hypothetical protein